MRDLGRGCLTCGTELRGRMDKKFCDDYCRSAYNNKLSPRNSAIVRNVNRILRRNRMILEEIMSAGEETMRASRASLQEKGFNFNYLTSAYINKEGMICYFCYEYGYLMVESDWYCISKRRDAVK
jgi:hypothetical protein